jgi:hypothetical protein
MGATVTTAKAQMEQEQDPNAAFPWFVIGLEFYNVNLGGCGFWLKVCYLSFIHYLYSLSNCLSNNRQEL